MHIASLSANSLWKTLFHRQIWAYMKKTAIAVLCLQATQVQQTTQYVIDEYRFVLFSGMGEGREYVGVGFVFAPGVGASITGFEAVGSRIAAVGIDTSAALLTLISAYIPPNTRPEADRAPVWDALWELVEARERKGPVMVLGDLNARLHARLEGERDVIGPNIYGLGVGGLARLWREGKADERSNRDILVEKCRAGGYRIMNTWFKKPERKHVTFYTAGVETLPKSGEAWDPGDFGELDMCVVKGNWKSMVMDVEADTQAGLQTDHFPLLVKCRLKRSGRPAKKDRQGRFDFGGAGEEKKAAYDRAVQQGTGEGWTAGMEVEEAWGQLKGVVKGALEANIDRHTAKKQREWISEDTLAMIEHRRTLGEAGLLADARGALQGHKGTGHTGQGKWVEEGLQEKFWEPIKSMTRKKAPHAVRLAEGGKGTGEAAKPCEVYANYIEKTQWEPARTRPRRKTTGVAQG